MTVRSLEPAAPFDSLISPRLIVGVTPCLGAIQGQSQRPGARGKHAARFPPCDGKVVPQGALPPHEAAAIGHHAHDPDKHCTRSTWPTRGRSPMSPCSSPGRGGDQAAWDALVDMFSGLLWAIARLHRLGPADAADVFQTTWLRLVEHRGALKHPDRVGAWLATTARRECVRRCGRRASGSRPPGGFRGRPRRRIGARRGAAARRTRGQHLAGVRPPVSERSSPPALADARSRPDVCGDRRRAEHAPRLDRTDPRRCLRRLRREHDLLLATANPP